MTLTHSRLKEVLSYDPETGAWSWLVQRGRSLIGSPAGTLTSNGYLRIAIDGRKYFSNRLAWFYMTGSWPPVDVDHKDREKTNDRWSNLRLATKAQNRANSAVSVNNELGLKGVYLNTRRGKPYRAQIKSNGKIIHLGLFETAEAASAAYGVAATRYFGQFARSL